MIKFLLAVLCYLSLGACTHLQSVSVTPIPKKKGKAVTATATRNIIFYLNFDNDYVDEVVFSLKQQCRRGVVKGILTKDEIVTYFPIVFHQRVVTANGYCLKKN